LSRPVLHNCFADIKCLCFADLLFTIVKWRAVFA
jgi:hypothetical protein